MPEIDEIAKVILAARRKRFLFSRPLFKRYAPVSEAELFQLANRLHFKFIVELSRWLLMAGYGEIGGSLIFQEGRFSIIDWDPLKGFVSFAKDISGYRFAFNPKDESIYCIHPSEHAFVHIADNFSSFLRELIQHDYHVKEWVSTLPYSR
ncbi:MAG: SMI1/KNR4 family protein [Gallionellaceae bacterium]